MLSEYPFVSRFANQKRSGITYAGPLVQAVNGENRGVTLMATAIRHGRTLRASLCEVERGVFYATYTDCESTLEADELSAYQVGTCAAEAKQIFERGAQNLGYDTIIWTETIVVPLFASLTKAAAQEPPAIYVAQQGA